MLNKTRECSKCGGIEELVTLAISTKWHCEECWKRSKAQPEPRDSDEPTNPGGSWPGGSNKPVTSHSTCSHNNKYSADFPGWGIAIACQDCGTVLSWDSDTGVTLAKVDSHHGTTYTCSNLYVSKDGDLYWAAVDTNRTDPSLNRHGTFRITQ